MPIILNNVEVLKSLIRANAAHYEQDDIGRRSDCGTAQCMAGFCLWHKVGTEEYQRRVNAQYLSDGRRQFSNGVFDKLFADSIAAGIEFLGIEGSFDLEGDDYPVIFHSHERWPQDLSDAYEDAETREDAAEVACQALARMDDYGNVLGDDYAG